MTKSGRPDDFAFAFTPRTARQAAAFTACLKNDITFVLGPAGSGKTAVAMAAAIQLYRDRKVRRIVLTRPLVEAGEKLGYLPGLVEEKTAPYMAPALSVLGNLTFGGTVERIIERIPLAFMRGLTFDDAAVLLDEGQNCTLAQLRLFLTRIGKNSKLLITGDPEQIDIRPTVAGWDCDLDYVADRLLDVPRIAVIDFEDADVVRHPLISAILKNLDGRK